MQTEQETVPTEAAPAWFHSADLDLDVERAARVSLPVLISGERGAGKRFVARRIHERSDRRRRPFVWLGCGRDQQEMVMPHGATVVLGEVFRLRPTVQSKLERFLGGEPPRHRDEGTGARCPDIRILSTMTVDPALAGPPLGFSAHLFYRLNAIHLVVPPLRDHRDDIPLLLQHWAAKRRQQGRMTPDWSTDALDRLTTHRWPGNIRELKATYRSFAHRKTDSVVSADDVALALAGTPLQAELR